MERLIKVTKTDIKKGKSGCAGLCPVARAIKRSFRISKGVSVGDGWDLQVGERWLKTTSPRRVTNFVWRFDDGLPVKPFEFKVKVMEYPL